MYIRWSFMAINSSSNRLQDNFLHTFKYPNFYQLIETATNIKYKTFDVILISCPEWISCIIMKEEMDICRSYDMVIEYFLYI